MPKILVVEDNEMNRDMLCRRLKKAGFEVISALNGEEALQKAHAETPHLILMDMSLPVMDGWEATRRLKGSEKTRAIPVIALTAHAMIEDLNSTLEGGCNDYHSKPIDFKLLLEKIHKFIKES
ncbi:MAG: response regulator [Chlamydiales bacterium]|nr:response regulator [Chlamydiales bacterium]